MAEPCNLEALRSSRAESGFLNVKVTTSGKFQAQLFIKAENRQRGLGTFDTAEEAAVAVARAKRAGQNWAGPTAKRAQRGTVRRHLIASSLTQLFN